MPESIDPAINPGRRLFTFASGILAASCALEGPRLIQTAAAVSSVMPRPNTDQSVEIQNALDKGGVVLLYPGQYNAGGLVLNSFNALLGQPGTVIKHAFGKPYLISVNPGASGSIDPRKNVHSIHISGVTFLGNAKENGFSEHTHLLNLNACSDVTIENCRFENFQGDAIYIGSGNYPNLERHNENISISECTFTAWPSTSRNGVSIIDGRGVSICKCTFVFCSKPGMPGAIDIEPDESPFHVVRDIVIRGNRILECLGSVGSICLILPTCKLDAAPENLLIEGNYIDGRGQSNGIILKQYCESSPGLTPTVSVVRNHIEDIDIALLVSGIPNTVLSENLIIETRSASMVSHPNHSTTGKIEICQNRFIAQGRQSGTSWVLNPCAELNFSENTLEAPSGIRHWSALQLSGTEQIDAIRRNTFIGPQSTTIATWSPQSAPAQNLGILRRNNWLHGGIH